LVNNVGLAPFGGKMKSFYVKVLSVLAIIGLGILVYSNTFFSSFHFDDDLYIINNFAIRDIHHLLSVWKACPCRFITFLSIILNYHFSQLHVLGYHLFNIAVHLGSAILVWWLVLLTFSTPALKEAKNKPLCLGFELPSVLALLAGLIFVAHPVQIEAVTYIWQRAASLAAFFYLASLCCYIQSRLLEDMGFVSLRGGRSPTKQSLQRFYYILSIVLAVLAMFTKENAITLPLMILLYEISFLKDIKNVDWKHLFPFWIVLFIIPETMVLTGSGRFQEINAIVNGPGGITPWHYLLTQLRVMITYIRLSFFPINLNLDYDYSIFKNFFETPVLISFIFLAAILYWAKCLFLKYRIISFSIFWFFLTLLPESSIVPQEDVIFEHRLYLPLVGYSLFLVSGVYYLAQKFNLKAMIIFLTLMIVCYSVLTYERNKVWTNEIILWEDVVNKSPHKARAYNNRGWAYYNQGQFTKAMADYNKALAINPGYIFSYDDRGLIYAKEGKYVQAIAEYNKAIAINPNYAMIYYNRGCAYLKKDNDNQALLDFDKAIILNPEYIDAQQQRDIILNRTKR